jgi:hypothetical protein
VKGLAVTVIAIDQAVVTEIMIATETPIAIKIVTGQATEAPKAITSAIGRIGRMGPMAIDLKRTVREARCCLSVIRRRDEWQEADPRADDRWAHQCASIHLMPMHTTDISP